MKCLKGKALNSNGPENRVIWINYDRNDEDALIKILGGVGIEIEVRRYNR